MHPDHDQPLEHLKVTLLLENAILAIRGWASASAVFEGNWNGRFRIRVQNVAVNLDAGR